MLPRNQYPWEMKDLACPCCEEKSLNFERVNSTTHDSIKRTYRIPKISTFGSSTTIISNGKSVNPGPKARKKFDQEDIKLDPELEAILKKPLQALEHAKFKLGRVTGKLQDMVKFAVQQGWSAGFECSAGTTSIKPIERKPSRPLNGFANQFSSMNQILSELDKSLKSARNECKQVPKLQSELYDKLDSFCGDITKAREIYEKPLNQMCGEI